MGQVVIGGLGGDHLVTQGWMVGVPGSGVVTQGLGGLRLVTQEYFGRGPAGVASGLGLDVQAAAVKAAVASASDGFTASAVTASDRDTFASVTDQVGLAPDPASVRDVPGSVLATLTLIDSTTHDNGATVSLGRFRRGDRIPIALTAMSVPDSPPVVTILTEAGELITTFLLSSRDFGATFSKSMFVDRRFSLGTFRMTAVYLVSGVSTLYSATFVVVPGGDSAGSVLSIYSHGGSSPARAYILAQLENGQLVQGANPHL